MTPDDDRPEKFALKRLEAEWFRAQCDGRTQQERDDIREAICLARGWRFER